MDYTPRIIFLICAGASGAFLPGNKTTNFFTEDTPMQEKAGVCDQAKISFINVHIQFASLHIWPPCIMFTDMLRLVRRLPWGHRPGKWQSKFYSFIGCQILESPRCAQGVLCYHCFINDGRKYMQYCLVFAFKAWKSCSRYLNSLVFPYSLLWKRLLFCISFVSVPTFV